MKTLQLTVLHEDGLHARPAMQFVETASSHEAEILIRNLTVESEWVDAKSILGILSIGVCHNHTVAIEINGVDEMLASDRLSTLIHTNFEKKSNKSSDGRMSTR